MYQILEGGFVRDVTTGSVISNDPGNKQYQQYLNWLAAGNTPEPAQTPQEAAAEAQVRLKAAAQVALDATDVVALRCWKANVPYPAAWQAYTTSLRNIVNGTDTTSTSLSTRPAYPAGT